MGHLLGLHVGDYKDDFRNFPVMSINGKSWPRKCYLPLSPASSHYLHMVHIPTLLTSLSRIQYKYVVMDYVLRTTDNIHIIPLFAYGVAFLRFWLLCCKFSTSTWWRTMYYVLLTIWIGNHTNSVPFPFFSSCLQPSLKCPAPCWSVKQVMERRERHAPRRAVSH